MLLQFNPNNKPTCNQILDNYIIKKKLKVFSVFLELIKKRKFLIFDLIKLNVLKVVKILLNYFLNLIIIKMIIGKAFLKMIELFIIIIVLLIFLEIWIFILFKKIMMKIKKMIKNKLIKLII